MIRLNYVQRIVSLCCRLLYLWNDNNHSLYHLVAWLLPYVKAKTELEYLLPSLSLSLSVSLL